MWRFDNGKGDLCTLMRLFAWLVVKTAFLYTILGIFVVGVVLDVAIFFTVGTVSVDKTNTLTQFVLVGAGLVTLILSFSLAGLFAFLWVEEKLEDVWRRRKHERTNKFVEDLVRPVKRKQPSVILAYLKSKAGKYCLPVKIVE